MFLFPRNLKQWQAQVQHVEKGVLVRFLCRFLFLNKRKGVKDG